MERNVPLHVGFIMDGNGRWATARGKSRNYGHMKGVEVLEPLVKRAIDRCKSRFLFTRFRPKTGRARKPKSKIVEPYDERARQAFCLSLSKIN